MCGIFFLAGCQSEDAPVLNARLVDLLNRRGPDSRLIREYANLRHSPQSSEPLVPLTFYSSVLSLRGNQVVQQPLEDEHNNSLLCWNGEAWSIAGQRVFHSDTLAVQHGLMNAARKNAQKPASERTEYALDREDHVANFLASISGPFAVVFYDVVAARIYFARDCLGRRSLLVNETSQCLALSSIGDDGKNTWAEIDADGIYVLHLTSDSLKANATHQFPSQAKFLGESSLGVSHFPWIKYGKMPTFNRALETHLSQPLTMSSKSVDVLKQMLVESINLRLGVLDLSSPSSPKFAILFSGGLDCSVLACMIHDLLPLNEEIDLLNVAFQNPRQQNLHGTTDKSAYENCPDRITARKAHAELSNVCPRRVWRLVEIDIPFEEAQEHRETVVALMYPHDTEMDRSIALALYFAARGRGFVLCDGTGDKIPYESPARVLFSGLGADELFGGYQRHATAFFHGGIKGLVDALELDITRLGKRNLGRDDRVMSHWGKETRYPYLDEPLVHWATKTPVWAKCGFGQDPCPVVDSPGKLIEPGKQILRLLALKLGMRGVACEKKRAIQFGARTAKMEGQGKGTQTITKTNLDGG